MRAHRIVWVTLLSAAAIAIPLANAWADAVTSGTLEFTPTVSFSRSSFTPANGGETQSNTLASFDAQVGRYFDENWEIAGSVLAQHVAAGGDGRNAYGGVLRGIYNAPAQGTLIPFASLGFGALQFDSHGSTDRAILAPVMRAGFRSAIGDNHTVNVSVGYQHEINSESAFEDSANLFDIGIGFTFMRAK